jgi:L-arabinose isomerase
LGKPRVAMLGVGLAAYWPQFKGMREAVSGHYAALQRRFPDHVEVISAGLVDTADAAHTAGRQFKAADVDLVFCHLTTYASSETLLPAVRELDVPVVLLNVQSVAALDMSKVKTIGDWLGAGCTCAGLPEMTAALLRLGKRFAVVTGHLEADPLLEGEIRRWCIAVGIRHRFRNETIGVLGRFYPGMMDLAVDETHLFRRFGVYVRHLLWEDISAGFEQIGTDEKTRRAAELADSFDHGGELKQRDFESIAEVLGALEALIERHRLCALPNHYETTPEGRQADLLAALNPALSVLNTRGIACPVEADIKTALAMLMLKPFAGSATLAELYSMDFREDICIIGHSGAGDAAISDRKPRLAVSDVFHGKSGRGYLTQFYPAEGPVTLLSLTQDAYGEYRLVAAEGECVSGPTLGFGDTNGRIRFKSGLRAFVNRWAEQGPTHHGALGRGHHVENLRAAAKMFDLPLVVVD